MEEQAHYEVIPAQRYDMTSDAMSPDTVMRQVKLIQQVMKEAMTEGEHYGVIPGTEKQCPDCRGEGCKKCKGTGKIGKPSLYKPGAEKLSLTFRLSPSYEVIEKELPKGHREYRIKCTLIHIPSQTIFGEGVGSCSTMEGKYRFRKADQKCPKCGKETIIKGKKEYGGGWICYVKKGGCGAKFKDGDPEIENQSMGRIEHDNPADYYNTVLKMAKKRAHVDATLTATAASDIFTQDLEDMPEVINAEVIKSKSEKPSQDSKIPPPVEDKEKGKGAPLEAIKATASKLWPSQSKADKDARKEMMKVMFGTDSWSKITEIPVSTLKDVAKCLPEFETHYQETKDIEAAWQRTIMGTDDDIPEFENSDREDPLYCKRKKKQVAVEECGVCEDRENDIGEIICPDYREYAESGDRSGE